MRTTHADDVALARRFVGRWTFTDRRESFEITAVDQGRLHLRGTTAPIAVETLEAYLRAGLVRYVGPARGRR